jgi:hypothetical protein
MRISRGITLLEWGILRVVALSSATIFALVGFSQTNSAHVHLHSQRH